MGLPQNSDPDALTECAVRIQRQTDGKGPSVHGSAERSFLAADCKVHFADSKKKMCYDNTLAVEPLDDIQFEQMIEEVGFKNNELEVASVVRLVGLAQKEGVDAEVAAAYIATHATNKNLDCKSIDDALEMIQNRPDSQSYSFLGKGYRTEKELARALAVPINSTQFCRTKPEVEAVLNWLRHVRGNAKVAEQIQMHLGARKDFDDLDSEVGRCMAIHLLDPAGTVCFQGVIVDS